MPRVKMRSYSTWTWGCRVSGSLLPSDLLELGHHALIGEVDLVDLDLAAVVEVEQVGTFL